MAKKRKLLRDRKLGVRTKLELYRNRDCKSERERRNGEERERK